MGRQALIFHRHPQVLPDIVGLGLGNGGGTRQLGGRGQILIVSHLLHAPIVAHRGQFKCTALRRWRRR